MMRSIFASLALATGVLFSLGAQAQFQPVILLCGQPAAPCTDSNPLPTTATVAAGTFDESVVAIAALPTLAPGTVTPRGSLAGAQYMQPVFGSASGGGTQVDATAGLPIASTQGSAAAKGGAITLGGTSQTAIASNGSRKGFIIQNPCSATEQGIVTAEDLFINLTSAATVSTNVNLAALAPCASFSMGITGGIVSTEAVTVIGATTAHIWYGKEF